MARYPMKLNYIPKNIIWGGDRLKREYGKEAPFNSIAESWELTVRKDGLSVITNGIYAGKTLKEYISESPLELIGQNTDSDEFPLLIKFIDAKDDLSVQVHPDDEYSMKNEHEAGKTEIWYIVDAEPGAKIVYGLKNGCTEQEFKNAVNNGDIKSVLNYVSVKKGEGYFIPSGQVHAICKGILIAEIQQNSNITYRLYDYERMQPDGSLRELHISKALDTVKCYADDEINELKFGSDRYCQTPIIGGDVLCDCKYFRVTHMSIAENEALNIFVSKKSFVSLLFIEAGETAEVYAGNTHVKVLKGNSIFIPAGTGEAVIKGKASFLISEI